MSVHVCKSKGAARLESSTSHGLFLYLLKHPLDAGHLFLHYIVSPLEDSMSTLESNVLLLHEGLLVVWVVDTVLGKDFHVLNITF